MVAVKGQMAAQLGDHVTSLLPDLESCMPGLACQVGTGCSLMQQHLNGTEEAVAGRRAALLETGGTGAALGCGPF